jgi:hypothetical protein
LGKRLIEKYPWWRFESHPEWAKEGSFAAGIPGEVRFIYQPKRGIYNWNGPRVKNLERDVSYAAFYFDPASGRRFDLGTFVKSGLPPKPFEGQIGERQKYDNFEVSPEQFAPVKRAAKTPGPFLLWSGEEKTPPLPSPQDWVLVLERVKQQTHAQPSP